MSNDTFRLHPSDLEKLIAAVLAADGAGAHSADDAVERYRAVLFQLTAKGKSLTSGEAKQAGQIRKMRQE